MRTLAGHANRVTSVAALPKGRIVSGSTDWTLRVWDPGSGDTVRTLEGHMDGVEMVSVLTEGLVVSAAKNKTVRVWDIDDQECLACLRIDGSPTDLAPLEGYRFALAASSGLYQLQLASPTAYARRRE